MWGTHDEFTWGWVTQRHTAKPASEDKETTWDMWHFVMTLAVNFRFTNVEKLGQSIRYKNMDFLTKASWHRHLHNLVNWYSWDHDVLLHPDVFTDIQCPAQSRCPRPAHSGAKWWRIWDTGGHYCTLCSRLRYHCHHQALFCPAVQHHVFTP